jgi:hypothetical protein
VKDSDNSARRLHFFLEAAFQQGAGATARSVWAKVFGLREDDVIGIYRNLVLLADLADQVEREILAIPEINHPRYLRWLSSVRGALKSTSLEGHWSEQLRLLTEGTIEQLAFCAEKLGETSTETVIPDSELQEILAEIDALFTQVSDGSLDPELRMIILSLLETMRRAIAEYRIRGAESLREALARALGELLLNHPKVQEETKKKNPDLNRFFSLLGRIDATIGRAGKWRPFLAPAVRLFLPEAAADIFEDVTDGKVK